MEMYWKCDESPKSPVREGWEVAQDWQRDDTHEIRWKRILKREEPSSPPTPSSPPVMRGAIKDIVLPSSSSSSSSSVGHSSLLHLTFFLPSSRQTESLFFLFCDASSFSPEPALFFFLFHNFLFLLIGSATEQTTSCMIRLCPFPKSHSQQPCRIVSCFFSGLQSFPLHSPTVSSDLLLLYSPIVSSSLAFSPPNMAFSSRFHHHPQPPDL